MEVPPQAARATPADRGQRLRVGRRSFRAVQPGAVARHHRRPRHREVGHRLRLESDRLHQSAQESRPIRRPPLRQPRRRHDPRRRSSSAARTSRSTRSKAAGTPRASIASSPEPTSRFTSPRWRRTSRASASRASSATRSSCTARPSRRHALAGGQYTFRNNVNVVARALPRRRRPLRRRRGATSAPASTTPATSGAVLAANRDYVPLRMGRNYAFARVLPHRHPRRRADRHHQSARRLRARPRSRSRANCGRTSASTSSTPNSPARATASCRTFRSGASPPPASASTSDACVNEQKT